MQATRYLSGEEPVEVSAITTVTDPVKFKEVEESIVWQVKFPSGVLAQCSATYNLPGMQLFHGVCRPAAGLNLNPAYSYDGIHGRRSDGQAIQFPDIDQFAAEMDDFAQCILKTARHTVPGEEGLRDVKIMMAIYKAARNGKTVELS